VGKCAALCSTVNWLFDLHRTQPIAHAIGALAFVCVLGMALGSLKFHGISLGTAGMLFAGTIVGHFGNPVAPTVGYATVYPLTILLCILSAQALAIILFR